VAISMKLSRRTASLLTGIAFAGAFMSANVGAASAGEAQRPVYREFVTGDPKAKVTVIEYASLTCPHCAHFATQEYPLLKKEYIDTGKIKFVYRDFPLDGLGTGAALLARCAPNDRGKVMIELMFQHQNAWVSAERPLDVLRGYAQLAGMDNAAVDDCLKNEAILKEIQDVREKASTLYKVQATPSFFVGEELVEGNSYEALKKAIDRQLK